MSDHARRVVITGIGVVAPNGVGVEDFWKACSSGRSGIGRIEHFDVSDVPVKIGGVVKDFEPEQFLPAQLVARTDRVVHMALAAATLAIDDASLAREESWRENATVMIGTGVGGQPYQEQVIADAYRNGMRAAALPAAVPAHIAVQLRLGGTNLVISTACSSGANAIGEAFRQVRTGEATVSLTGGVETPLTPFAFYAHCALRVMSTEEGPPERVSKPFDTRRAGFVIAEGSAMLVLEELEHARARGARIYAEILGAAGNSGMYHIAIPNPTGTDLVRVMTRALDDAGLEPNDIDYVNAHGTGTKANDSTEVLGLEKVFGSHVKDLAISGSKSMTGHTLGAAGAIESAICALSLHHQVVTPTINLDSPEFDYDFVAGEGRPQSMQYALSNSFGFGSNNSCLVFGRWGATEHRSDVRT